MLAEYISTDYNSNYFMITFTIFGSTHSLDGCTLCISIFDLPYHINTLIYT